MASRLPLIVLSRFVSFARTTRCTMAEEHVGNNCPMGAHIARINYLAYSLKSRFHFIAFHFARSHLVLLNALVVNQSKLNAPNGTTMTPLCPLKRHYVPLPPAPPLDQPAHYYCMMIIIWLVWPCCFQIIDTYYVTLVFFYYYYYFKLNFQVEFKLTKFISRTLTLTLSMPFAVSALFGSCWLAVWFVCAIRVRPLVAPMLLRVPRVASMGSHLSKGPTQMAHRIHSQKEERNTRAPQRASCNL